MAARRKARRLKFAFSSSAYLSFSKRRIPRYGSLSSNGRLNNGRVNSVAAGGGEEELESVLSNSNFGLPFDLSLLQRIISCLPFPVRVQLRLLSKSWHGLLCSRTFLQTLPCLQQESWLVMVRITSNNREEETLYGPSRGLLAPKELIAYCPSLRTWFPLPLHGHADLATALGPGLLHVPVQSGDLYSSSIANLTLASSGGLICCVACALRPPPPPQQEQNSHYPDHHYDIGYLFTKVLYEENFRLVVFNCFTGALKFLPPVPPLPPSRSTNHQFFPPPNDLYTSLPSPCLSSDFFLYMFPDTSAAGAYKIVLSHGSFRPDFHNISVYASKTGCWQQGHGFERPWDCNPSGTFEDVCNADLFRFDQRDEQSWHRAGSLPYTPLAMLSGYNVGSDTWSRIEITPAVPRPRMWDSIFKCQGRVFLASPLYDELNNGKLEGFKLYELRSSSPASKSVSWMEVAQTPHSYGQVYGVVCDPADVQIKFVHNENAVCMTGVLLNQVDNCKSPYWSPLVYDITGGFWYQLPSPCSNGTSTNFVLGLFALHPQENVMP